MGVGADAAVAEDGAGSLLSHEQRAEPVLFLCVCGLYALVSL